MASFENQKRVVKMRYMIQQACLTEYLTTRQIANMLDLTVSQLRFNLYWLIENKYLKQGDPLPGKQGSVSFTYKATQKIYKVYTPTERITLKPKEEPKTDNPHARVFHCNMNHWTPTNGNKRNGFISSSLSAYLP